MGLVLPTVGRLGDPKLAAFASSIWFPHSKSSLSTREGVPGLRGILKWTRLSRLEPATGLGRRRRLGAAAVEEQHHQKVVPSRGCEKGVGQGGNRSCGEVVYNV